ncbi:MAG: adenylosuccinate lyase [Bacteroidota bacterium]
MDALHALSPLDGRYRRHTEPLRHFFSEAALIRYRIRVEVEYLIALAALPETRLPELTEVEQAKLRERYNTLTESDIREVKATEREINHDVKAVEYFVKRIVKAQLDWDDANAEFVHFGLTSQDINNTAFPMMLRDGLHQVLLPELQTALDQLALHANNWAELPMLARTHGQPASPTSLGKEMRVFIARLEREMQELRQLNYPVKFGGATGNLNAHVVAYPDVDWHAFADRFVQAHLGEQLERSYPTTQIEHYDGLARIFDSLSRLATIWIDFARDAWQYISMGYFKQKLNPNEVGSSAMPHKVNPIDFENAEGNLGLAIATLTHLSHKLPISRLQRDLTDSTVLRNIGVPLGHLLIAAKSLQRGLSKIEPDPDRLQRDLDDNWAVLAEAIQTILRREGYPQPYEALKALTRTGEAITKDSLTTFVEALEVQDAVKAELLQLTPADYTGRC